MRTPNLEAKLELLMSLAGDDREELPHEATAAKVATRERCRGTPTAESAARSDRKQRPAHHADAHPDDERVQLQLPPREVVYDADGNLPLAYDPKTAWALAHPEHFPMELRAMGVVTTRAACFLTLAGRKLQSVRWSEQLGFWRPD